MTIVRNSWYLAAWSAEVTSTPLARRICNRPVVLYRSLEGQPYALIDSCAHRGAPLSLGTVTPQGIRCNYHGVVFGCDGACVAIPNQDKIPEKARVESFPLLERQGMVWIWIGEAEKADPALAVDYPFHDDAANWPSRQAMSPVASSYLLIADNLLDATHLSYVHQQTVGGSAPEVHMKAESSLRPTAGGLRLQRMMRGAPPPPAYLACVPFEGAVDRWQEFDFLAPSTVLQYSGAVPAGLDRATAGAPRFDMRIFHTATPATDNTCYYFWSVMNGHDTHDPRATEIIYEQVASAILEDKLFIERQQAMVDELGEERLFDNAADAPRIMARRAVRKFDKVQNAATVSAA
jgi:vanillate O-demethylase monooxygenase subunit